jgi:hypothetical protein
VGWTDKILKTIDGGKNWISESSITSLALKSVYFIDENNGWVVGVNGTVLKMSDGSTHAEDNQPSNSVIPDHFVLFQNYPNPFNPSTSMCFHLPQSSFVTLKIYNLLGQEIETIINEQRFAGTHEINWTARGVPSGIYFYRLIAGEYVDTKKFILQK